MANNRIGIKVAVEFPSATELQAELNRKWQQVKDKYDVKVNVTPDGRSLRSMRTAIQTALNEKKFDMQLDTTKALKSVATLKTKIGEIDTLLKKNRTIKIDLNFKDIDKRLSDVIKTANDKSERAKSDLSNRMGQEAKVLKDVINNYDKMSRKVTTNAKGTSETLSSQKSDGKGNTKKQTVTRSNAGITTTVEDSYDRDKALNKIKGKLNEIHAVETKIIKARADGDKVAVRNLTEREEKLKRASRYMFDNYKEGTGKDANSNKGIKDLKDTLAYQKKIAELNSKKSSQTKEQAEVNKLVGQLVAKKEKLHALERKLVNATGEEAEGIQKAMVKRQAEIDLLNNQNNLQGRLQRKQKEVLQQQDEINALSLATVKNKKAEKELSDRQVESAKQLTGQLKTVKSLEERIYALKKANTKDGDTTRIAILEEELQRESAIYKAISKGVKEQGLMTDELKQSLAVIGKMSSEQKGLIASATKLANAQDDANKKYSNLINEMKKLGSLQNDLVYAGMRERSIIDDQINKIKEKIAHMKQEVNSSELITAERKAEIRAIEQAQAEQRQLNRLRQESRELDRNFNTAGGQIGFQQTAYSFYSGFREILREVSEVDEAYMKIKKVAEESDEALQKFRKNSFDQASELGVKATEYMSGVEKWMTSGFNLEKSVELAKTSSIGSFVGNITSENMQKYLSVPLNAFKKTGIEATDIINVMNETSNNHAIEMEELGRAYVRSASSMTNVGVTFQELTGFITGAQEATKAGGERIGTSFKSISSNYASIKGQLTGQQTSKHDWFEQTLGISIDKTETMTELFTELAGVWDGLSDTQRNTSTFYLAGKEHQNTLTAMLNEWEDTVIPAIGDSNLEMGLGKQGSAYQEFAEQRDSVRFQLAEVQNAWSELMDTLGRTDGLIANILKTTTRVLQTLNDMANNEQLVDMAKLLITAFAGFAISNGAIRSMDMLSSGSKALAQNMQNAFGWTTKMGRARLLGIDGYDNDGSNRNGGDSTVIAGGNSDNDRANRNNNNNNNNNNGNSNNGNNNGGNNSDRSTIIAGGGNGGNNNNRNDSDNNGSNRPSSRAVAGAVGKVGKGLLGAIPIVGTGLAIAELLGVDVFGGIGKGIDMLFTNTEERIKQNETKMEDLFFQNELLNGKLNGVEVNTNTAETVMNKNKDKEAKNEDGSANGNFGYLEQDDFKRVQEQLNKSAETLEIDVKVEYNNPEHIQEAINKINAERQKREKSEAKKAVKTSSEVVNDNSSIIVKEKAELDEKVAFLERLQADIKTNEAMLRKAGLGEEEIKNHINVANLRTQVEYAEKDVKSKAKEVEDLYKSQEASLQEVIKAILVLSENGSLEGLNPFKEVKDIETAKILFSEIAKYVDSSNEEMEKINPTLSKIKDSSKLTGDEFGNLQKVMGELDVDIEGLEDFKNWNYDDYLADLEGAVDGTGSSLQTIIDAYEEMKTKSLENGEYALTGAYNMLRSFGIPKQGIQDLMIELGLLNTTVDEASGEVKLDVDSQSIWDAIQKADELDKELLATPSYFKYVNLIAQQDTKYDSVIRSATTPLYKSIFLQYKEKNDKYGLLSGTKTSPSVSSNSVSSIGGGVTAGLVSSSIATGGVIGSGGIVSNATSSSKKTTAKTPSASETESANAKVSEDIWRYWKLEDKLDILEHSISSLDTSINLAGENYDKMISLYKQQIAESKNQKSTLGTMRSAKTSEAVTVLKQLKGYGFNVNTNNLSISNLESQSKKLKGDKATGAEELLNTWKALKEELRDINQEIRDIDVSIKDINEAIKTAQIDKEAKALEKTLDNIDKKITRINNKQNINQTLFGNLDDGDFDYKLMMSQKMSNDEASNVKSLIAEFNALSIKTIGFSENAETVKGKLEALQTEILSSADAFIEYNKQMNDLQISRIASDIDEVNKAFGRLDTDVANSRDNVAQSLLGGTKIGDLQGSTGNIKLDSSSKLSSEIADRVNLEERLASIMDSYAQKNVDRTAKVANSQLQITTTYYDSLIKMASNFQSGVSNGKVTKIDSSSFGKFTGSTVNDSSYKLDSILTDKFNSLNAERVALDKAYSDRLSSTDLVTRRKAEYEYQVKSLELEQKSNKVQIEASRSAISYYQELLKNGSLTESQRKTIEDSIKTEQEMIQDSQNNIKDIIAETYEFRFGKMNELLDKYDEYNSLLSTTQTILETVTPNDLQSQIKVSEEILANEKAKKEAINQSILSMQKELALLEVGSYEWSIVNGKLDEFNSSLIDSNSSIASLIASLSALKFEEIRVSIENDLHDGKSASRYDREDEMWYTGLERELKLEDLYEKIAELGTNQFDKQMELLEKKEKLSNYEIDLLEKQMELAELQEQLEAKKERNVKTLSQNADGTYSYKYVEEDSEDTLAKDIRDKKREILELEKAGKKSYQGFMEEIIADILAGNYKEEGSLKEDMDSINEAFGSILESSGINGEDYMNKILEAYKAMQSGNQELIDELLGNQTAKPPTVSTIDNLQSAIVDELKKLGDKIAGAIDGSPDFLAKSVSGFTSKSMATNPFGQSISIGKVEFPNATSSDEIKDAIMNLPRYAMQQSKRK